MQQTKVSKKSDAIDRVLHELMSLPSVTSAAVVDGDGFVTHIRKDFEVDTDALGAAVQIMLGAANRSALHVGHSGARMVIGENRDGLMIVAPLPSGFTLAIVADENVMLGSIRFEVKESLAALNRILGSRAAVRS